MNPSKKLRLLGLVFVAVINIPYFNVWNLIWSISAYPNGSPNFIDVCYFPQRCPKFCGQASAQMVLQMVLEKPVSQFRLEKEMEFIEGAGTLNRYMKNPFQNRGIKIISVGFYSNLGHLIEAVNNECYSIINIRFDKQSSSGHYVVVTGYNETGFFVHDPWPEEWGKATGRNTGENVYLSNELLKELWAFRRYWVLTVTGSNSQNKQISHEIVASKE